MKTVRIIRQIHQPGRNGPRNGQWALQRALRAAAPAWLQFGGEPQPNEVPWFWSWQDAAAAVEWAEAGRPFVLGPNVLYSRASQPRRARYEQILSDAASCRLLFTESFWYRDLIAQNLGPSNRAPIVVWPYPIDPAPGGPLEVEHDLLIYAKSGFCEPLIDGLVARWPRSAMIRYGHYDREQLVDTARRSRACAYLSDDDRGPLALAEILLCGCPAAGVPRGAPFAVPHTSGAVVPQLALADLVDGVERCHALPRDQVAAWAAMEYAPWRIAHNVLKALAEVAR